MQRDEIWRNFAFDKREQAAPQHRASSLHSVCTVLAIRFIPFRQLLYDQASIGLDGGLGATLLVDLDGDDRGLAGRLVDVVSKGLAGGKHRQVEGQCQWFLLGVEACDVPLAVSSLTGEDNVTAGIAVDEACLLPGGGKAAKEVEFKLRQFAEVVRLHGDTLHGGLHDET